MRPLRLAAPSRRPTLRAVIARTRLRRRLVSFAPYRTPPTRHTATNIDTNPDARAHVQALGIDALHRMGVVHRDLKAENVLVDRVGPGGNARIADFNAALVVSPGRALADGEVFARDVVGSEPYVAWEVGRRVWYGKAVDWWALGCLVFDLVANSVSGPRPSA